MKIVKHGCVIDFLCPVCSCEFLMSADEEGCRQQTDKDERKGDEVQYLAVCPDCGEGDVPGYKKQYGDLPVMAEEQKEEVKTEKTSIERESITYTKETDPL